MALAVVWIYIPSLALQLFRWAASIRDWVVLANWPPQYEVALRFFVDERQIVYTVDRHSGGLYILEMDF